jgi:hypothetical protein
MLSTPWLIMRTKILRTQARRAGYTAILDDTRLGLIRLAYTEDWGKIVFVEIKALSSD